MTKVKYKNKIIMNLGRLILKYQTQKGVIMKDFFFLLVCYFLVLMIFILIDSTLNMFKSSGIYFLFLSFFFSFYVHTIVFSIYTYLIHVIWFVKILFFV